MKFLFLLLMLIGIGVVFLTPATDPIAQQQVTSTASGFVVAAAAAPPPLPAEPHEGEDAEAADEYGGRPARA